MLTKQLKKQKEHISKDFEEIWKNEDCSNIISEGRNLSPHFEELLKEVCHAWYDKGIKAKQDEMDPIYGLVEQKMFDDILVAIRLDNGITENRQNELINFLNSIRFNGEKQNPAEWSEKDEKIRYDIECALKFFLNEGSAVCPGTNTLKEEAISWLKSLRPQPKAEWSEEDEKRLESVIHRTEVICGCNAYGEIKEDIDWLKSLRPNHWKPSEEQMQYLSKAISYCIQNGNEKTACVIKELKNDLEKL